MNINQFDLWIAQLPALPDSHIQQGRRPVVVVSGQMANRHSPVITVVPTTSQRAKRSQPTHVFLMDQGLDRSSIALCEQVMSLDKTRLLRRIGHVYRRYDRMAIRHALMLQLGVGLSPDLAA